MKQLIVIMAIMLMIAGTVTFTVKDRNPVGSDGYWTVVVESTNGTDYYLNDVSYGSDAMGEKVKVWLNQYKPNTTHTVDIDPLNNIWT